MSGGCSLFVSLVLHLDSVGNEASMMRQEHNQLTMRRGEGKLVDESRNHTQPLVVCFTSHG